MVKVNQCTGEVEYDNGCTAAGYFCSVASVFALFITIPILHTIYLNGDQIDPLVRSTSSRPFPTALSDACSWDGTLHIPVLV